MTREQLEHAIRAACDISQDNELYIFGSQAILGQYPDADEALRQSVEVDLCPKNKPENIDKIDGAIGENSLFHQTHSFYVHGVLVETASLPDGWKKRTIKVFDNMDKSKIGLCVEAHDLAASKLMAFREKDTEFVRKLLIDEMIKPKILLNRIKAIDTHEELEGRALRWVQRMSEELS